VGEEGAAKTDGGARFPLPQFGRGRNGGGRLAPPNVARYDPFSGNPTGLGA